LAGYNSFISTLFFIGRSIRPTRTFLLMEMAANPHYICIHGFMIWAVGIFVHVAIARYWGEGVGDTLNERVCVAGLSNASIGRFTCC
jgi:hypothetical protein